MNWKTLALGSAVAGVAVAGCGTPAPAGDAGADGGPPATSTYVLGMIDTSADDPDGTGVPAYGFDLDGMMNGGTMTGCTAADDHTSPITGDMAVDNQLGNALSLLESMLGPDGANGAIRDQIEAGKILLMLEVSDINSYADDPNVMVHAVLGQVQPEGPACAAHTDQTMCEGDTANMCAFTAGSCGGTMATACQAHTDMASCVADTANGCSYAAPRCATMVTPDASTVCAGHTDQASCDGDVMAACSWSTANNACSGIAGGQTFALLTDLGTVQGSITNHRLEAITTMLPLHFEVGGNAIDLTLRTVHFGGTISATNIVGGEFGAQVLVEDIITLGAQLGFPITQDLIDSVVMPDLMPDATGAHCGAISAGMGYTAIAATLAP